MLDTLAVPNAKTSPAAGAEPVERLLTASGDSRLLVDPGTRLNAYGCSPAPRPWAITFASTTATSISDYAYAAVERCRARVLAAVDQPAAWRQEIAAIRRALLEHYRVDGDGVDIVLTPSGTDGELCALAVHRLDQGAAPVTNLVIAPEETGTGVALAAAGRHFAAVTARGVAVEKGGAVDGLADGVALASVAIRAPDGAQRLRVLVDHDVEQAVGAAIDAGRRVLLHVLDVSKTGLLAPSAACVARLRDRHGDALEVLVDACQGRLSAPSVRAYLVAGAMVLVTGSKFFTGPPFAGALLLPPAIGARLRRADAALPAGLAAYGNRAEWPVRAVAAACLPDDVNVGLVLRWVAALAEMAAFEAVAPALCRRILESFGSRIRAAIDASRDLILHPVPPPTRQDPLGWDALTTIFSFSVRGRDGKPLDVAALRAIHRALNRDLSADLAGAEGLTETDQALAAQCCHIGQPVVLASASGSPNGREVGVLRIAAGARLVSGVWNDPALGPDIESRLAREIADAIRALDKISLILRYPDAVAGTA